MHNYRSNGKLLLSGEYVVLDGALALAIPTRFGQSMMVGSFEKPQLVWRSLNHKNEIWFEAIFPMKEILTGAVNSQNAVANRLIEILQSAKKLNPRFLDSEEGYHVTTHLEFSANWGLGSSSTLINNVAQWAGVDPYKLLELTFGGSGYDIACAMHESVITYRLKDGLREVTQVSFNPPFREALSFVYLNRKQNSRESIVQYKARSVAKAASISEISDISSKIVNCRTLEEFDTLITSHEQIISKIIGQESIKKTLFNDYPGAIKSLGGWGGDFVLVTGDDPQEYFRKKGYITIIPYADMTLG
jgi:mevalonate kinase